MTYENSGSAADRQTGYSAATPIPPTEPSLAPHAPADVVDVEDVSEVKPKNSAIRATREIFETLLLALVIFVGVRLLVLNFRVDGLSMSPNLDNREMLLVNRNAYAHFDVNALLDILPGEDRASAHDVYPFDPPERGDIIVFNPPAESDKPYIKRIVGLPGDVVAIHDGSVFIDGQQLPEPYIDQGITDCVAGCDTVTVPPGSIYVLGDNRNNSSDSRVFGPVKISSIVGKAWLTYWPSDDIGIVPHFDYPGIPER